MRARLILAAGTAAFALAGSVFAASPALAACGANGGDVCSGSTVATFTLTGGTLQISVPSGDATTPDTLGGATAVAGSDLTVSGNLGAVTVNDQRAALAAAWAVTVSSTDFTTGSATAQETVLAAAVGYATGNPVNDVTGYTGLFTPATDASLAAPAAGGAWAGVGVNTVSWDPNLSFTLLPDQVAGTYQGTITHTLV